MKKKANPKFPPWRGARTGKPGEIGRTLIRWAARRFISPKAVIFPSPLVCSACGKPAVPVAYDTGDGWLLGLYCPCEEYVESYYFDWPDDSKDGITSREIEGMGFKVI